MQPEKYTITVGNDKCTRARDKETFQGKCGLTKHPGLKCHITLETKNWIDIN